MADSWQVVTPLETEDPAPVRRRSPDLVALVPGVLFVLLALTLMTGVELPRMLVSGGFLWVVLIGLGAALLLSELRRNRRPR